LIVLSHTDERPDSYREPSFFDIRLGKFVEFEKGKTGVRVASIDKLPSVIDTLITAVRNGELDAQLEAASVKPTKKAAKKQKKKWRAWAVPAPQWGQKKPKRELSPF
jgi:hypothetical protein